MTMKPWLPCSDLTRVSVQILVHISVPWFQWMTLSSCFHLAGKALKSLETWNDGAHVVRNRLLQLLKNMKPRHPSLDSPGRTQSAFHLIPVKLAFSRNFFSSTETYFSFSKTSYLSDVRSQFYIIKAMTSNGSLLLIIECLSYWNDWIRWFMWVR